MQFALLKALSPENARLRFRQGKLSSFDYALYRYLGEEKAVRRLCGADIRELRQNLSLTQEALGEILDVTKRTILRWENDQDPIPRTANIALNALWTLEDKFFDLMKPEGAVKAVPTEEPIVPTPAITDTEPDDRLNDEFDTAAITDLRERLRMTRTEFADFLSVSTSTLIKWETGAVQPKGPALTLLKILRRDGPSVMP